MREFLGQLGQHRKLILGGLLVVILVLGWFYYGAGWVARYYEQKTINRIHEIVKMGGGLVRIETEGQEKVLIVVWEDLIRSTSDAE